jgi:hypothetical protein
MIRVLIQRSWRALHLRPVYSTLQPKQRHEDRGLIWLGQRDDGQAKRNQSTTMEQRNKICSLLYLPRLQVLILEISDRQSAVRE